MARERPMILFFSHKSQPEFISGAEKTLLLMITHLRSHYDCRLVVPKQGILSNEAQKRDIPVYFLDYPIIWEMVKPDARLPNNFDYLRSEPAYVAVRKLIGKLRPNLLVTNTFVNVLPAMAGKEWGIPVVWNIQEVIPQSNSTRSGINIVNTYADWILGLSQTALRPFRQHGLRQKTILLYPTWWIEPFTPRHWHEYRRKLREKMGVAPHEKVIGYVSVRVSHKKGLLYFIKMAHRLCKKRNDVHFLVRAEWTGTFYQKRCRDWIKQTCCPDRFHLIDFVGDVQQLYPAIDILVVPSLVDEGFGLAAVEGMVFGKPVVAFDSGGLREMMVQTRNESFLVPKEDVAGLTQKVTRLLDHPVWRDHVGKQNRKKIERFFGAERYRQQLETVFIKIFRSLS
jgi:glycosyltransferase involved in cell wall biosynthesis